MAQRFDGAVRLNVYGHILAGDGAWLNTPAGLIVLPTPCAVSPGNSSAWRRTAMTDRKAACRIAVSQNDARLPIAGQRGRQDAAHRPA